MLEKAALFDQKAALFEKAALWKRLHFLAKKCGLLVKKCSLLIRLHFLKRLHFFLKRLHFFKYTIKIYVRLNLLLVSILDHFEIISAILRYINCIQYLAPDGYVNSPDPFILPPSYSPTYLQKYHVIIGYKIIWRSYV